MFPSLGDSRPRSAPPTYHLHGDSADHLPLRLAPFLGGAAVTHLTRLVIAALAILMPGVAVSQAAAPSVAGEPVRHRAHGATMTIGRLHYEGGGDWYAHPSSLPNLLHAIRERTRLPVSDAEVVVSVSDDKLWSVPYLHMTGHGNVHFSDQELVTLRRWLWQGGFLHANDCYGMDASFRREMKRLFPDHPLVEVPLDHPIYHVIYDFPKGIPKIHEHDRKPAQGFGIFLDGRLAVFYDYQSDLGDGWEDPEVHHDPPDKHEAALRMGVNLFAYAVGYGG